MGVDYYDCELCGESTNDCVGNVNYVISKDGKVSFSYACCEDCSKDFESITGARKDDAIREYRITRAFLQNMIDRLDSEIAGLKDERDKLRETVCDDSESDTENEPECKKAKTED